MTYFIPLLVWAVVHTYKYVTKSLERKSWAWSNFTESGGMPSSHSAVVASLCTILAVKEGWSSPVFAAAVIFSIIIIHDALRLRSIVEVHSKILNKIRLGFPPADQKIYPETIEHVGHQLPEVVVGVVFGILGTLLLRKFL